MADETNLDRRSLLKTVGAVAGMAFLDTFTRGPTNEDKQNSIAVGREQFKTSDEKEARLKLAGLGGWINYYRTIQSMRDAGITTSIFPEITGELESVADGRSRESLALTEGWKTKAKDPAELLAAAREKASNVKIETIDTDEKTEKLAGQVLINLGEVFPVLMVLSQDKLIIDGTSGARYANNEFVQVDDGLFTNLEETTFTLIHEIGHLLDWGFFGLEQVDKVKKYVPPEDVINYVETYGGAIYNITKQWSQLPYEEAVKMKYGMMLTIKELIDTKPDSEERKTAIELYQRKTKEMEMALAMDDKELKRRQDWASDGQLLTTEKALEVKYNILAHEYMSRIFSANNKPERPWIISGNPALGEARNMVVEEISHFLVGPIYGGGHPIFQISESVFDPWVREMNTLMTEATRLEEARMRFLTANSKVLPLEQFRHMMYDNLVPAETQSPLLTASETAEFVPDDDPWEETTALTNNGISEVARFNSKTETPDGEEDSQYRIYRLPNIPKNDQMLYLIGLRKWAGNENTRTVMSAGLAKLPKREGEWTFGYKSDDGKILPEGAEVAVSLTMDSLSVSFDEDGVNKEGTVITEAMYTSENNWYVGAGTGKENKISYLKWDEEGNPTIIKRQSWVYDNSNRAIPLDYSEDIKKKIITANPLTIIDVPFGVVVGTSTGVSYTETAEPIGTNVYEVMVLGNSKRLDESKCLLQLGIEKYPNTYLKLDFEVDMPQEQIANIDWASNTDSYFFFGRNPGRTSDSEREYSFEVNQNKENGKRVTMIMLGDVVGLQNWPEGKDIFKERSGG